MTTKESLDYILQELPDDHLREVLDFARFLSWRREAESWRRFGMDHFAQAYGTDEPEYTQADLKPKNGSGVA